MPEPSKSSEQRDPTLHVRLAKSNVEREWRIRSSADGAVWISEVTVAGLTLHTALPTLSEAMATRAQHLKFIGELIDRGWTPVQPSSNPIESAAALPRRESSPAVLRDGRIADVRVLVVDDEPPNLALAERVLVSAGYAVTTATDAEEALGLVQTARPFDLCVLDIVMPGMQGTELAACIRLLNPDVKLLFYTAYSRRLFRDTRVLDDNAAFLQKPAGVRELAEAVSYLLFGHLRGPGAKS